MFHLPDIERQRGKKETPLTQASYSGPPRSGTPSRGSIRTGGGENQLQINRNNTGKKSIFVKGDVNHCIVFS